jgi:hypothetical protein
MIEGTSTAMEATSTGSTETSSQATSTTSQAASASAAQTPAQSSDVQGAAASGPGVATDGNSSAQANPYTPNFKFKWRNAETDAKVEQEFDDWAKQVVKDSETEKKVRELYEKAYGLDYVKPRFHKTREQLQTLQKDYEGVRGSLQELGGYIKQGDFDSFFKALKISDDQIYNHVLNKLQYQQLPPEQRYEIDRRNQEVHRAQMLEKQNQAYQAQINEMKVQQGQAQLNSVLSKPEIQSVAQQIDQKKGEGSFIREVILRAAAREKIYGVSLTPEQAVKEVIDFHGLGAMPNGNAAPQPIAQGMSQASQSQMSASNKPPVIPNVGGRNTSPAKQTPRSIADIKKLAEAMS